MPSSSPPVGSGLETARIRGAIGTRLFGVAERPPRIGRFTVLEPIGAGGMGVVYAAYDSQLDRRVALKVLRAAEATTSSRAAGRLLREAQTLAKLSHPNVVVVHEAGVHDGHVYIAMEFITGGTLTSWCERNPVGPPERFKRLLDLLVQAARGLAAAHDAGLVHRDLKPANLLVDEDDRLRVADFGLARAAELESEAALTVTREAETGQSRSDAVVGTPAYMPPEQIDGRSDARSDQWALCATFWEAAFGERPFAADSFAASVAARIDGRLPTPTGRADVPAWFRAVLARGLAPEPAERFADIRAMLAAIDRGRAPRRGRIFAALGIALVAASTAAAAAWPAPVDESVSPCRAAEHGLDALWSSEHAAELAALLGGTGEMRGANITARIDAFAQRWRTGAEAACESARARGELEADLADVLEIPSRAMECYRDARVQLEVVLDAVRGAPSRNDAGMLVQAVPDLRRCEDEGTGAAWDMGASRDAAVALARASAAGNLKDLDGARRWLHEARVAIEGRSLPNLEARAFLVETFVHYGLDEHEAAMASARRALTAAEAGDEPADVVRAWLHLADSARSTERYDEAQFYLDRADSLTRRAGDPPWLRAKITEGQARLLALRGDSAAAHRTYAIAKGQLAEIYGEDSSKYIAILRDAAAAAKIAGETAASFTLLEEAIAGYTRLLGPTHTETIRAKATLAIQLSDAGDFARALPLFEEASAVARTAEELGPHNRIMALANHAQLLGNMRRFADAQALMGEAAELARTLLGPHDTLLGVIASMEGSFALDAGDYDEAIAIYEPLRVRAPGPNPIARRENGISVCVNLATAYAKSGTAERAGAVVQDCESMLAKLETYDPSRHGAAYRYVAGVHAILGDTKAARTAYERALALLEPESVAAVEAAEAQLGFASLLLQSGDVDTAADYLERARRGAAAGTDDLRARVDALAAKLPGP